MKLVVGLGNPGPRYVRSRHNVGFRVIECLADRLGLVFDEARFEGRFAEGVVTVDPQSGSGAEGPESERLGLLEPLTFMNRSGESVSQALAALPELDPARDLVVVYDDLDLPLGRLRVRPRGGPGGHRGLESVISALGTREIPRLRFGIGRPPASEGAREEPAAERGSVVDFVLDDFSEAEEQVVARYLPLAADAVECLLWEGAVVAMDRFNGVPDPEAVG